MLVRSAIRRPARRGATLVETAMILSLLFLLLLGIILGSAAVFNYQQVSYLAREGSRWAIVRGASYAREQNTPAATAADVRTQAVLPQRGGMQADRLTCTVAWDQDNKQTSTVVVGDEVKPRRNTVSVTVTYQWDPIFIFGPFTLQSTSVADMHY